MSLLYNYSHLRTVNGGLRRFTEVALTSVALRVSNRSEDLELGKYEINNSRDQYLRADWL